MAKWDQVTNQGNVDDRRGSGPLLLGGMGIVGVISIVVLNFLGGGDLLSLLNSFLAVQQEQTVTTDQGEFEGDDKYEVFVANVLGSNNDYWSETFLKSDLQYQEPTLVLFRNSTGSGCGTATSDVGPHYCPLDQTIYLDETFFDELQNRFGAEGGDLAEAYVISHEVGHHVQNLLGTLDSGINSNDFAIKVELQADCYAGLWAGSLQENNILEPGDINEAIDAAAAVGDDRIQEQVTGQVNPETWTHGSSEQRVAAFREGFEQKDDACDYFN